MQQKTYFAKDGSFGDARGLVVLDTSNWTEADWDMIHNLNDNERVYAAVELNAAIAQEAN